MSDRRNAENLFPLKSFHTSLSLIVVFFTLFMAHPTIANTIDSGWTKIRDDGTIWVYSQKQSPGKPIGIRGVSRATVRFEVLSEVLLDVPNYPRWMEQLKESRIVEHKSADNFLLYNYYDLPWPFADRDIYVRVRIETNITQGVARATIIREESPARPPIEGVVRIPAMEGILEIRYINRETTEGSFTEWFDMGGIVPEWVKETFARRTPSTVLKLVGEACLKPEFIAKGAHSPIKKELEKAIEQGYLKR